MLIVVTRFSALFISFVTICFLFIVPEENIANAKHSAMVIKGEMRACLLDGDSTNYDLDRGFTRHPIEDSPNPEGIVIRLGKPSIVNTIKLLLWDRDMR